MSTVDQARLRLMDKYWSAANYLTIGQIYLQENPLLREPLRPDHIKPRLLGHWGTSPEITQDADGMRRLFRQFSTPGGVPSHVSVPTPGSIHEGGELGYVL